jgi:hypothetical protein
LCDWEDPGYLYIWSDDAVRLLARFGIENHEAVIAKVADAYQHELEAGNVREPERLARTMVRRAGLSALRAGTVPHMGHRRPIVQLSLDRHDQVASSGSPVNPQLHGQPPDEVYEELRRRLRRDEEQADHRSKLEQLRRRFAQRLSGHSQVTCALHERSCPQDAKVLLSAHELVTFLGNALDEQENGTWEPSDRHRRAHQGRTQLEWDQQLHRRLLHLATQAAALVDPATFDGSQGGRQARSRLARCVLHVIWCEAEAAEFKFLARQAGVTVECVYAQLLRRQGISDPARERLLGWLETHQERPLDTEGEE